MKKIPDTRNRPDSMHKPLSPKLIPNSLSLTMTISLRLPQFPLAQPPPPPSDRLVSILDSYCSNFVSRHLESRPHQFMIVRNCEQLGLSMKLLDNTTMRGLDDESWPRQHN